MNKKLINLFWGLGLVAVGFLALAQTMGYLDILHQAPVVWITGFAGLSLLFLITYASAGVKHWGLLFPAGIFASLALIIGLAVNGFDSSSIATPLFAAIGLPFLVAYFLDRSRHWWALIPAGVMTFLTLAVLMVDGVGGEWVGSILFFVIALAFLLVYLGNRSRTWAALVAYILFVFGFMPLMALTSRPEFAGVLFLTAAGLPFLLVYLSSPLRWWAIIPAGLLLTTGLVAAIATGFDQRFDNHLLNSLEFTGFAATFAIVWLRHERNWARFFTLAAALIAVASLFINQNAQLMFPLLIIAAGLYFLYTALRPRPA
jgi:hypothetical protein